MRALRRAGLCLAAGLAGLAAYAQGAASNETLRLLTMVKTTKGFDASKSLGEEQIRQILAAGVNAPSAMNKQPWFFSAVTSPAILGEMREAATANMPKGGPGDRDPLDKAGAVILVSGTKDWRWSTMDCALACEAMSLAAQSMGLGTHIVAAPVEALKAKEAAPLLKKLGLPSDKEPLILLLVGYPAIDATSKASTRVAENFKILK
jgi:nitroreductase